MVKRWRSITWTGKRCSERRGAIARILRRPSGPRSLGALASRNETIAENRRLYCLSPRSVTGGQKRHQLRPFDWMHIGNARVSRPTQPPVIDGGLKTALRENGRRFFFGEDTDREIPNAAQTSVPAGRLFTVLFSLFAAVILGVPLTWACPFCTAVRPSWSQQREAADLVAIGTLSGSGPTAGGARVLRLIRGELAPVPDSVNLLEPVPLEYPGRLALLLGRRDEPVATPIAWTAWHVGEACLPYAVQSPDLRLPTAERLSWFAKYLEHPEPLLAEDAYLEFGHAPYDAVAAVADRLPFDRLRQWLVAEEIPAERKGLYGLLLGLAPDEPTRAANADLLRQQIVAPQCDFRSGFDGVLGGYLVAAGPPALELLTARFLDNLAAAEGDVRHCLTALRFYHEFGREIPPNQIASAAARLLARPSMAATVVVDLARWQHWPALEPVTRLYVAEGYPQPATRRAVVGYLLSAPAELAQAKLDDLRRRDPQGVADGEEAFERARLAR